MNNDRFGKLRKHQLEALILAQGIAASLAAGLPTKRVMTLSVTPGGGKTKDASLVAHVALYNKIVDRVCHVVPNSSLREQVAAGFTDIENGLEFRLRVAGNGTPLVRDVDQGFVGYVTTYQSIAAKPSIHAAEFQRYRYLLILDEVHHVCDQKAWQVAIHPLYEMALANGLVLNMSGTIIRHDSGRIPFVGYTSESPPQPVCDVVYGRQQALDEQTVLPMALFLQDGVSSFAVDGFRSVVTLSEASEEQQANALRTALATEGYRRKIVDDGMLHLFECRRQGRNSKCIVICDDQDMARETAEYIKARYADHGARVGLAIGDEPDSAGEIRSFRRLKNPNVLVTVQMASEGLDVPAATHMILLTRIRSWPWIAQALARVTRFDRSCGLPYEQQYAFIFAPDDPAMRRIAETINEEQRACHAPPDVRPRSMRNALVKLRGDGSFEAISAEPTVVHGAGDGIGVFSDEEQAMVDSLRGVSNVPAIEIVKLHRTMGEQDQKRSLIQKLTNERDERRALPPGSTNKQIRRHFGKGREAMGLAELDGVLAYLRKLHASEAAQ